MKADRGTRSDAVMQALQPLCDDAADMVIALSDALVSIYIVGGKDCTRREPMQTMVDLFAEKTMETYDDFMADRGEELRKIICEERAQ